MVRVFRAIHHAAMSDRRTGAPLRQAITIGAKSAAFSAAWLE
jgi:hypothetical protein